MDNSSPVKHVERARVAFERVCSIPPSKMHPTIEENSKTKKVNIIVKVVSANGVHIQDCSNSKKGFLPTKSVNCSLDKKRPSLIPPSAITALPSSKDIWVNTNAPYHGASFPFHFVSSSNVINWSQQDEKCTFFYFQRELLQNEPEDDTILLKAPCNINLSITRAGQTYKLGRAEFWGHKVGEQYIDIPIINETSTRKHKRFRKGMKLKTVKIEEHSFKYGLESNATLRVKVILLESFHENPEKALVAPSYLQYTVPPSRVGSPMRVRSIKKSISESTDYTNSTGSMSSESSQSTSSDWGIEVQYKLVSRTPIHPLKSCEVVSRSDEDTLDSYVSAGSEFVSRLGEKYINRLNLRHVFICNFPDCGIDDEARRNDTFEIDDELSSISSVAW